MKSMKIALSAMLLISSLIGSANAAPKEELYIDSSLSFEEQKAIKQVMLTLDKEDRENVLYIKEDGTIIANKKTLKDEFVEQNKDKIENGKLRKATAEELRSRTVEPQTSTYESTNFDFSTAAYSTPTLNCTNTVQGARKTGPFRRVESTKGYTRLEASIYLPSKVSNEAYINPTSVGSSNDKGYIYTGSYIYASSTSTSIYYTVDLGLALNYDAGATSSMETWGMYINGGTLASGTFGNFKLGSTVAMKYYISSDNNHTLTVAGYDKNSVYQSKTVVMSTPSSQGFTVANANKISVRRVTSIAQTENSENFTTGSYIKNVGWSDVKVGTSSTNVTLMNSTNTSYFCAYNPGNVQVDYVSQAQEKVWVKAGTLP